MLGFGAAHAERARRVARSASIFGGAVLTYERLLVIVVTIVLLGALWLFLRKTRFGWALRAVRAGPRGGGAAGHLHQPDRALSPCSSARRLPASPAR